VAAVPCLELIDEALAVHRASRNAQRTVAFPNVALSLTGGGLATTLN
jgi:hypothetical protein